MIRDTVISFSNMSGDVSDLLFLSIVEWDRPTHTVRTLVRHSQQRTGTRSCLQTLRTYRRSCTAVGRTTEARRLNSLALTNCRARRWSGQPSDLWWSTTQQRYCPHHL